MLVDQFFEYRQHCDTRWVELFSSKHKQSKLKKVSFGRICVQYENMSENVWLNNSHLCLYGRPTAADDGADDQVPVAQLPLQSELLLPVSASPDKDISINDRFRPCIETARAQKGPQRDQICFSSLYRGVPLKGPSILCNLTGNVEDAGVAAIHSVLPNRCFEASHVPLGTALKAKGSLR